MNNPKNNTAIGIDLDIIVPEQILDTATMKPVLKLTFNDGTVEVGWIKGDADTIRIEVDRDGKGFQFLAIGTVQVYTDATPFPVPGTWKYRAIYLISNEPVGQWSNVVTIIAG